VGSDPHLNPATDEPLTQYCASLYLESRRGKAAANESLDNQVAMNYQMMRQAGEPDGIADQPTGAFASALQYAGVIYGKAPLFYRAARKQLGDATFDKVLNRYATRYRFTDAPPDGFVQAAKDVAPKKAAALAALHDRWFGELHGDEDIGQLDYGKLIEASTGMRMSAEEKAMMQQLMPQLMEMMKGGVDPSQLMNSPAFAPPKGQKGKPPPPPSGIDLLPDDDSP
jgi:hypothetical protein